MRWIAISGGWRKTTRKIENQVRQTVRGIIQEGNGLVSGGALGVDFIALDEALKYDPEAERIKIFLPTTLEKYIQHYQKQARLGRITRSQAENLAAQLSRLKQINSGALIEHLDFHFTESTKKRMYYERDTRVVQASEALIAFHIQTPESKGLGTRDTIRKAQKRGIPVKIFHYLVD